MRLFHVVKLCDAVHHHVLLTLGGVTAVRALLAVVLDLLGEYCVQCVHLKEEEQTNSELDDESFGVRLCLLVVKTRFQFRFCFCHLISGFPCPDGL
jgi:hypothetical protein